MLIYMSAYNAPDYVVSIFNPAYFAEETAGGGLSTAQASALFLKKTSPDTATVLETFTAGIATSTIGASSVTTVNNLFNNVTTGTIEIGSNDTRTGRVDIGTGNAVGVAINIGHINAQAINLKAPRVNVGGTIDRFTAGALNIASGSGTVATSLNLGTSTGVTTVGIGNTVATTVTTIQNPTLKMNYTTAPSLTNVNIGYSYIGAISTLTGIASGSTTAYAYSPSTGVLVTGNYLVAGKYTMSMSVSTIFGTVPSSCSFNLVVGIVTSSTTNPAGITTPITNGSVTVAKSDILNTTFAHYPTFVFTVTTAGYYYAMGYLNTISMTGSSPTISLSCQITNLSRIA